MRATLLIIALLAGSASAQGRGGEVASIGFDLSLELPVPLAAPVADASVDAIAFDRDPTPLELRANHVFEVPRFFQPGPDCGGVLALWDDVMRGHLLSNPMTVERIDAFWVPITGKVDSVLVIDFYDPPRRTRAGF